MYNSQVAVPIVLFDLSGFKTTQSSIEFPVSRLHSILKNLLTTLVDVVKLLVHTGLNALVSTNIIPYPSALAQFFSDDPEP
ncbi:MAG: hypothetical protein UU67_C0006G0017 [Candidatus Daviesbacteria bacterium GW2011_GWB1_41_5]|uniref:Uncharacterized protein n=1 Tax=Candidatus Daviesbacteria bacterium GW2011_GWB1_41_5 TaxID=1618429 RepID=A0A0G0WQ29_9BACT|nr:MAG: hypothetical protein UU67_C0006G0017 [Candidatus Daviesbacteria bacterium GW2011_GWB1_41_5]